MLVNTKVTPNISNDRNPKTFEVGLSASASFTELEMLPRIGKSLNPITRWWDGRVRLWSQARVF